MVIISALAACMATASTCLEATNVVVIPDSIKWWDTFYNALQCSMLMLLTALKTNISKESGECEDIDECSSSPCLGGSFPFSYVFVNCGPVVFSQVPAQIWLAHLNALVSKDGGWKISILDRERKNLPSPDWTGTHLNARTSTSVPSRMAAAITLVSTLLVASTAGPLSVLHLFGIGFQFWDLGIFACLL